MASTQVLSGRWRIAVVSKDADFSQRFIIAGSDASDGVYPGETTTPLVSVSGPRWFLRFEWNDNAGSGWQPSGLRRTAASYTLQEGLVTILGADDNFEQFRDHDFNDLVLRCRNLDPELNPRIPLFNMPDFTLPIEVRKNCPTPTYDDPYGHKRHDHPGYERGDSDYVDRAGGQDRGRNK